MNTRKSNLFTLAKYINQEFIIEELLRVKELATDTYLSKYTKKKRTLKIKILLTKIFYSIIFGILPVIPLMTYFGMTGETNAEGLPISVVIYGGSILFIFFFILQFLNVFFMGMTEISVLMSNSLFLWLETLPISSKKISRLKLISIFRNFDIPIIVMIFAFPIVILYGTLSILLFFVCLGISTVNIIFSFSILILFGDRINRIVDINLINSRKTMIIRLINTFGYVIVFFASLIFVQWAISSIPYFFRFPMVQRHPEILNLILCTIPYPFSSSYLVSFISSTNQIHFHYWIGMFCGLGLFIIFTRTVFIIALKSLDRITSSRGESLKKHIKLKPMEKKITIKIRRPILAHFIKDLSITSRNIKVFLSAVTPIIISFVFTYTFNFTVLQGLTPLDTGFFYNWVVILAMQPIICGMLIYNLMNLEGTKESLQMALPIIPKNQAKAKLLYFLIIQTVSVISPYLIYIYDVRFVELLIYVFLCLPFAWIILFSMFEMYIYLFGRKKNRFVLDPVHPENKTMKWVILYMSEYVFYTIMVSTGVMLALIGIQFFLFNFSLFLVASYIIILLSFKMLFSPFIESKPKIHSTSSLLQLKKALLSQKYTLSQKQIQPQKVWILDTKPKSTLTLDKISYLIKPEKNFFVRHPWISILLTLLLDFIFIYLGNLFLDTILDILREPFPNIETIYYFQLLYFIFPVLILYFLNLIFIPKHRRGLYKDTNRFQKILNIFKIGILGTIPIVLFHYLFSLTEIIPFTPVLQFYLYIGSFGFLAILLFATWHEILFRGIVFPILRTKYNNRISLCLSSIIFFSYHFIYFLWLILMLGDFNILLTIFLYLIYMLVINVFLTYLFIKRNSFYPALIVHLLTTLFGLLPMWYFGFIIFFPNIYL